MREIRPTDRPQASIDRRHFLAAGAASVAGAAALGTSPERAGQCRCIERTRVVLSLRRPANASCCRANWE